MDKNDIQFTNLHNELKSKDAIPVGKKLENNDPDDNDFKNRNKKYTELIGNYSSSFKIRHEIKAKLKTRFFWVVMGSYIGVIAIIMGILIAALCINSPNIALIIGTIGSLVTAIIGIPTIIANNLFPKDEDGNIVEMTKEMFQFDKNYFEYIEVSKNKINNEKTEKDD